MNEKKMNGKEVTSGEGRERKLRKGEEKERERKARKRGEEIKMEKIMEERKEMNE